MLYLLRCVWIAYDVIIGWSYSVWHANQNQNQSNKQIAYCLFA